MKKVYLLALVALCAVVLTGCDKTNNTADEAESGVLTKGNSGAVNTPPSPPVPTRPAGN